MNTIKFKKMEPEANWYLARDFRKYDYQKIKIVLMNMLNNLKEIRPEFNFNFFIKNADSLYQGGFSHKLDKYVLELQIGKYFNKIELEIPKLVEDNCFMLNGSLYVPIFFLERAPIDRVGSKNEKKNKILLNILTQPIVFDWNGKKVKLNRKSDLDISVFFKAIFYDESYSEFLQDVITEFGRPMSGNRELSFEECKIKTLEALSIAGHDRFNNLQVDEFFDKYILLDYFKETFFDYYGQRDFKNIVRVVYEYYKKDIQIDMADVRNRRIVMTEYLMSPIFEWYSKIIYNFTDSAYREFLIPSLKENSIIAEGFREIMHGEQLFNITLPYITPIVHKVSQAIIIITGKVPKKWTSNHPSAMGVFCPISVSAQDMGQNLVMTMESEINFYGRIKSRTMSNPGTLVNIQKIIPTGFTFGSKTMINSGMVVDTTTGEVLDTADTKQMENETFNAKVDDAVENIIKEVE